MSGFFVLIMILWVVISTVSKKAKEKQKEAEREARRAAAASQAPDAPVSQAAPQPFFQPQAPSPHPNTPSAKAASSMSAAQPVRSAPQWRGSMPDPGTESIGSRNAAPPVSRNQAPMQTQTRSPLQSSLTEIQRTQQHDLVASSISGHAHEETSLTGAGRPCPPTVPKTAPAYAAASANSAATTFRWDVGNVRSGLIYGEILGKPKALRRR